MTATAPPPGTMARRAILRTAVPAMTAPGQPRHAARCPAGTFPARHAAPAHGAGNAQGPGPGRTRPFSGTVADAPSPRTRPPFPSRPAAVPIPPLAALRPCSPCRTARQRENPPQGAHPAPPHGRHPARQRDRPQRRCLRHQRPLSPRQRPDGTGLPCAPPQDEPPFPALRQLPDARLTFQGGHAGASAQGRFHRSGLRPRHAIPGRERPAPRARIRGGTAKQIFQPFRPEARLVQKISAPGARCRLRRRSGQPRQKQDRPAVGRPGRPGQIQAQQQGQQHAHDASPSFLPRRAACRGMRCAGTPRPAAPHWRGPASMSRPAARHDGLPTGQGSGRTGGAAQAARHRGPRGRRQATRARRPVPDSRT